MVKKIIAVVGGGIAGISCIESIISERNFKNTLILITDNRIIKRAKKPDTSSSVGSYDVELDDIETLSNSRIEELDLKLIVGSVESIDALRKKILYRPLNVGSGNCQKLELSYDILCLCHGAKPCLLEYTHRGENPLVDQRVLVLRDTDTVEKFRGRLQDCRRLAIVGNGGISLELVHKVKNCQKVWIVRDEFIGSTFFDSGAAKFLLDSISGNQLRQEQKRFTYRASKESTDKKINFGPALGPNWSLELELSCNDLATDDLDIIYKDEVQDIVHMASGEYPLSMLTRDKRRIDCDLVVAAIGVEPNFIIVTGADLARSSSEGGILVDEQMRTSQSGVYAAGDVVSCEKWSHNEHWLRMRTWTQARQMGYYAGKCIVSHLTDQDPTIYFQFDCFSHSTSFFGYKLILLGRYNGQACDSGEDLDVFVRVDPGKEYAKVLIKHDRVYGAVLVGDTGKEDMLENLIHNGLPIDEALKDCLLDDTIDLDDWYD